MCSWCERVFTIKRKLYQNLEAMALISCTKSKEEFDSVSTLSVLAQYLRKC
ncbi:hypothetical protein Bca101_014772 [Brassica carinata]